jgi:predicted DNA-binding mobile mystery protein A
MATPNRRIRELARQQLDQRLERIRSMIPDLGRPQRGWVSALRTAYAMSQADLARRMGISRQAVSQLEQRESDGSVTLKALEQAAQALGGELVYAIVPRRSISDTLEDRALRLASQMTASVRHTMRLEDQAPNSDLDERTRALARELLASPRQLWSSPHDE